MRTLSTCKYGKNQMHQQRRGISILNNDGFTFIESLFQIIILVIVSHFFMSISLWLQQINHTFLSPQDTSWEMFVHDMKIYLRESEQVFLSHNNKMLILKTKEENKTIQIAQYEDMIRKQVNRQGHVPLLMDIQTMALSISENTLMVTVTFQNGQIKERIFFVEAIGK